MPNTPKPRTHVPTTRAASAAMFMLTLAVTTSLHANHWPGWRGTGNGVAADESYPVAWDAANIRWKTPIPGRGHSSPIVWDDRIFLTTSIEGEVVPGKDKKPEHMLGTEVFIHPDMVSHDRRQTMKVMALDAKSGKVPKKT